MVVNDLGTDGTGCGRDDAVAQSTVEEIVRAGGTAVPDTSDIADPDSGRRLVELAKRTFGRIDIVVNNAGICGNQVFVDASLEDFSKYWRIHVAGSIALTQAAWPYMARQRYGRVVLTESGAGLYGLRGQATYAAAKGAIHGLMRTLALEGREHGILVNSISPGGFSRMHEAAIDDAQMLAWTRKTMPPELVAPAVVWLASENCSVSGQVFAVWAGRVARVAIGTGTGFFDPALTPEKLAEHYPTVAAVDTLYEPADSLDEVSAWVEGRMGANPAR